MKLPHNALINPHNSYQTTPNIQIPHGKSIHVGWGTKPMCQISSFHHYLQSMNFPK